LPFIGPLRENVGVTVDTSAVGPFLESKTDAVRQALASKMTEVTAMLEMKIQPKLLGDPETRIKGELPLAKRTRNLFGSLRPVETAMSEAEITGGVQAGGGEADYAKYLEYGTRAHIIAAVNAKALRFFATSENMAGESRMMTELGGLLTFAKVVHHPGNPAFAFMRGTLDENAEEIRTGFQETASEAARS